MKNFCKRAALFLCLVMIICAFGGCSTEDEPLKEYGITVFGDPLAASYSMSLTLYGKKSKTTKVRDEMVAAMREINTLISPSDSNSEVYKFNNNIDFDEQGRLKISQTTFKLFELSKQAKQKTMGYFDPAVYPLIELWNLRAPYTASHQLGEGMTLPTIEQINDILPYCNLDLVTLSQEGGEYFVAKQSPLVQVELGAIAKGYGADVCKQIYDKYDDVYSGLVNLSGNTYVFDGKGKEQDYWSITIDEPRPIQEYSTNYFCALQEKNISAVCSDDSKTYYNFVQEGDNFAIKIPHIINPKNGLPLNIFYDQNDNKFRQKTDGVIMTVIFGASSALCDAFSTASILMPILEALDFIDGQEGYKGFAVTQDFRLGVRGSFREFQHDNMEISTDYLRYTPIDEKGLFDS